MTQDELTRQEADLFNRWENAHKANGVGPGFTKDGIVDFDHYWQTHPRILYLLKEANWHDEDPDSYKGSDERKGLRLGGFNPPEDITTPGAQARKWPNWEVVARWTYALTSNMDVEWGAIDHEGNDDAFRKDQLGKIAVVNLKKVGGSSACNMDKLADYSIHYGKLVREQLGLYQPDVIVCNGTAPLVERYVFSHEERGPRRWAKNGIWWFEIKAWPCAVIDMYHFGARMQAQELHNYLIEAYSEIAREMPSLRASQKVTQA